jgi:hypothetical protein
VQRRHFIIAGSCGLAAAETRAATALNAEAAVWLTPDGGAQLLRRFTPAGGALQRQAARPGAWYALLLLPMAPAWPVDLRLWPAGRSHELHLSALDGAPGESPSVVHALPLQLERAANGRAAQWSSRFMLPAGSTAPVIFVLVEQWRIAGDAPPGLYVQLRTGHAPPQSEAPWWAARSDRRVDATPPPSPLTQQQRFTAAHEVPILELPATPEAGVWR